LDFGADKNTHPRSVKRMLTRRSPPHPATNRTPRGGTKYSKLAARFGMLKGDERMTVMITIQINSSRPIVLFFLFKRIAVKFVVERLKMIIFVV
jgi:hypothetical protein